MFKLILSKQVLKFIKTRNRNEKKLIETKFELLKQNPTNQTRLDIKQMQGFENLYRLRILKYRFIYEVRENELLIIMILGGNRGDIYKKL